ncbi:MAG: sugar transferase [Candidatus Omnitrophica bacterium]|nr:sugar transferase [Candidatus Omnitrophota bacterium]
MFKAIKYRLILYVIIDILLITISFWLPYFLKFNKEIRGGVYPEVKNYILISLIWCMSLVLLVKNYNLYVTERNLNIPRETFKVIKAVFFSTLLIGLLIFLLKMEFFSRILLISTVFLLVTSLSICRIIKRLFLRYRIKQGFYNFNVLIIGAGRIGIKLAEEIKNNPYLGLRIIGFLDDYKKGSIQNYEILGEIAELPVIIEKYFIDKIFISIPSERKKICEVLNLCHNLKKSVWVVPECFQVVGVFSDGIKGKFGNTIIFYPRLRLDFLGDVPLLCYLDEKIHGAECWVKRLVDIVGATIILIFTFPLFILIAVLIKLDSPGPVFYRSIRCGKKAKPFIFYKFRSMFKDAEKHKDHLRHFSEVKGPVFKIKNDPRVTGIGKILRRYSLDELPQLINVLKGDMSLVGPRPPTPDEVSQYESWQLRRLDVRPGITGLWQVRGRSDLSFYKWVKLDLWYIDNWSLLLDFKILLWTVPAVLKKQGAY